MAHILGKVYQEATSTETVKAYVAVCMCGWKEKAYTRKEVVERFNKHRKNPIDNEKEKQ
jgi:predicted small metal-binding protein